ncbi:MAG: hypothetical protein QNK83_03990, partial [Akkermansiaceae bacterium]
MTVLKVKYALWAADHLRAIKFYQETFGAELQFEMEVWSELTLCGSTIGIHGGGEGKRTWTGLSFQCDDVLAAVEKLKANGGGLVREPVEADGMVHRAFCFDTEGNEIMLTQKRAEAMFQNPLGLLP